MGKVCAEQEETRIFDEDGRDGASCEEAIAAVSICGCDVENEG